MKTLVDSLPAEFTIDFAVGLIAVVRRSADLLHQVRTQTFKRLYAEISPQNLQR